MFKLEGEEALQKKLKQLILAGDKESAKALRKGSTQLAKAMRKEAPVGKTKQLKKSVGSKLKRSNSKGIHLAKAGIGVGKKKAKHAPHGHLVGLGTGERRRKSGGSTGEMPANDFVKRGFRGGADAALKAILDSLAKGINQVAKR